MPTPTASRRSSAPSNYKGVPSDHPAVPVGDVFPLGDGVWLEPRRLISPELATALLSYNVQNRNAADRIVGGYVRNMQAGDFYDKQGDPIRFAVTGKLLDGQQRLMSVVSANTPTYFVVITGLPEASQETMDTGRRRTVSDQLKINGMGLSEVVASSARLLWMWENGSLLSNIPAPTNTEVLAFVDKHTGTAEGVANLETSARVAASAKRIVRRQSVTAALHYRMSLVDPVAAEDFWSQLTVGAIADDRSPILALRETLIRRVQENSLTRQAEWFWLIGRAWWLWRRGLSATRIQLPRGGITADNFPVIT